MIRLKRRNTAWLVALGALIAFALMAAPVAPLVQVALLSLFATAVVASTVEIGRERNTIMDAIRRAPLLQRVSPQAREAAERARTRGGFNNPRLMLLDLGLIAVQSSYEGMAMRRTRSISKDDDGVRPFVTLYVDPEEAERHALVRFEILNQFGDQQYVHEMRTYLRDGEMDILADHHLPMAGNSDITGAGDWDLRIYIDGNLVGMHNFMLAPSINDRRRRLANDGTESDAAFDIIDEEPQEIPTSLQDLMQSKQSTPSRSDTNSARRAAAASRRRR